LVEPALDILPEVAGGLPALIVGRGGHEGPEIGESSGAVQALAEVGLQAGAGEIVELAIEKRGELPGEWIRHVASSSGGELLPKQQARPVQLGP
jgi:hypothetical protein